MRIILISSATQSALYQAHLKLCRAPSASPKRAHKCSLNFQARHQSPRLILSPATYVSGAFFLSLRSALQHVR